MHPHEVKLQELKKELEEKDRALETQKKVNRFLLESKLIEEAENIDTRERAHIAEESEMRAFFEDKRFIPYRFAKFLVDYFPENGVVCIKNEKGGDIIWVYNQEKGIFENDGIPFIEQTLQTILREEVRHNYYQHVIKEAQVLTYTHHEDFKDEPEIMVVKNGCLNVVTGDFLPFSHIYKAKSRLPVTYNPEAKCPKILRFLNQVAPDSIDYLQEWVGYHLIKDYRFRRITVFLGEGDNGKTTFLNVLSAFLGSGNVSSESLHRLTTNRFATSRLFGKLANICGDIGAEELQHTEILKKITGTDPITGEQKNRTAFDFRNYAKLSFSCNKLPKSPDKTHAFYIRFNVVPFNIIIPVENQDSQLIKTLTSDEELSGFLNWGLKGLTRLLENKGFSEIKSTLEKRALYEKLADPVSGFVSEHIIENPSHFEDKQVVYNTYVEYSRGIATSPLSERKFREKLDDLVDFRETQIRLDGARPRVWKGIELRNVTTVTSVTCSTTQLKKDDKKKRSIESCDTGDIRDTSEENEV